ncbi:hypothetical protein EHLJMEHL_03005 [Vreelandella titanicae]
MHKVKHKVIRVKEAILSADSVHSLKDIVDSDESAFEGIRMLYSTNESGALLQVEESLRHVFSGIFSKKRLLAYSDSIRSEMEAGTSVICYKQRALFDTNLLSDLPRYLKGQEISTAEKIEDILEAVEKKYCGAFDYSFPMLENLRQFIHENNPHPLTKVSAAIYFDHKIRGLVRNSHPANDIFLPYYEQAESAWMNFRSSEHIWHMIDRRDLIYAVMLKTYHLCWTKGSITIESALNKLVDYCLNELGILPLKELYFSWKVVIGLNIGYFTPVFNEKSLQTPNVETVRRIGALAWDLFIFRFTESLLTEEKGNNFYIPSVTTLDHGLLNTISSCPVKAMISFPQLQYVETIFDDELLFHQCLNSAMSEKQKEKLFDEDREIKGQKRLRHFVSISIADLEKSIRKLAT